jgi:hypothetical protein
VGVAGWRRRADTNSNPVIIALALIVIGVVLAFFAVDTIQTAPETFIAIIALGLLAIILDAVVRRGQHIPPSQRPAAPPPVDIAA